MRERARRHGLNIALAVCSCVLCALAIEAGFRLVGYAPERLKVRYRVSNRGDLAIRKDATVLDCYQTNPGDYFDIDLRSRDVRDALAARGFRNLEAVSDEFPFAVEFAYNAHGFRDRPFAPKRPGVYRVAVVGDSFTEAQGVLERDGYVRVLERLLNRPGRQVETFNLGYRGLDLPALLDSFELGLDLEADVIVYGMVLNDGDRSEAFDRLWPRLNDWIMVRRPPVVLGPLDSRLVALLRDWRETREISKDTIAWYRGMYSKTNADGWNRTKAHLRWMKAEAGKRDVALLVALWPLLIGLEADYPFTEAHSRVAAVCGRNGIPFLDLLDTFRGHPSPGLWVDAADMHPNALGHRLAAEALAPLVAELIP